MSDQDISALKHFEETLSFDGNNYEVSLPWKNDTCVLKDDYNQAVKRLTCVEHQLQGDEKRVNLIQRLFVSMLWTISQKK